MFSLDCFVIVNFVALKNKFYRIVEYDDNSYYFVLRQYRWEVRANIARIYAQHIEYFQKTDLDFLAISLGYTKKIYYSEITVHDKY